MENNPPSRGLAAGHGRQAQITAHQMQVVSRQQNDLAGLDLQAFPFVTVDSDAKVAFDDVVINYQMGRRFKKRRAMLRRDACRYAPRREGLRVQEHAACQMCNSQDVG
jgi:hypothetical protein